MSTVTATRPIASSPPPIRRITIDEYERIIDAGALKEPSRVELIDGYMVEKMGKNAPHRYTTKETLKALDSRLPAGWTSQKEEPVRIPSYDEPEPDVAIIQGTDADYEFRLPTAADVRTAGGGLPERRLARTAVRSSRPTPKRRFPSIGSSI